MMCFKTVVFIVFFCLTAVVESRRPSFGYLAYHPYYLPKPVTSQTETAIENDVSGDTLGKEILGDKVTKLELEALTKNINDDVAFNNEPTPLSAAIGEENEINDDIDSRIVACESSLVMQVLCRDCSTRIICRPGGYVNVQPCTGATPYCIGGLCSSSAKKGCV